MINISVTYHPIKCRSFTDVGFCHGHLWLTEDVIRGIIVGSFLIHRKKVHDKINLVYNGIDVDIETESIKILKGLVSSYWIRYRRKRIPANNLDFVRGVLTAFKWLSPRTRSLEYIYSSSENQWYKIESVCKRGN